MTLHILDNLEQGSPEWHDARRGIVTASVVGKLLTPTLKVADNDTSRALTATLVAERVSGFTEDTPMTSDMWRGVEAEPYARDLYAKHRNVTVDQVGFMVLDNGGWQLGYSPDGLVGPHGLIEIKAPRAKTHVLTILRDEVPAHYMAQCQAGLFVSGRKWVDFISYCGGLPLFIKRVYAEDEKWSDAITDACITFERNAAEMTANYEAAVAGLPATERIDFNQVELKL